MEQLAIRLSDYLQRQGIIKDDEQEIYIYSFQAMLFSGGYWLTMLAIALLVHKLPECILYFVSFFLLRSSIGGYHASSQLRCAVLSVVSFLAFIIIIQYLPSAWQGYIMGLSLLVVSGSIIAYAPIDHPNRPFREGEKTYYRKRSILLLITVWVAVVIMVYLGYQAEAVCISLGAVQASLALLAAHFKQRRDKK